MRELVERATGMPLEYLEIRTRVFVELSCAIFFSVSHAGKPGIGIMDTTGDIAVLPTESNASAHIMPLVVECCVEAGLLGDAERAKFAEILDVRVFCRDKRSDALDNAIVYIRPAPQCSQCGSRADIRNQEVRRWSTREVTESESVNLRRLIAGMSYDQVIVSEWAGSSIAHTLKEPFIASHGHWRYASETDRREFEHKTIAALNASEAAHVLRSGAQMRGICTPRMTVVDLCVAHTEGDAIRYGPRPPMLCDAPDPEFDPLPATYLRLGYTVALCVNRVLAGRSSAAPQSALAAALLTLPVGVRAVIAGSLASCAREIR